MNTQEAFDKVWEHFIVEKRAPGYSRSFGGCQYFNATTGTKCAIGCLLSDDVAAGLTGSVGTLIQTDELPKELDGVYSHFLQSIQASHDRWACDVKFHQQFEVELLSIKEQYKLS